MATVYLACSLAVLLVTLPGARAEVLAPALAPGASVEGELAPGGGHRLEVAVAEPSYLRLEVTELGVDLRAELAPSTAGETGAPLFEVAPNDDRWDRYPLSVLLPAAGEHLLILAAPTDEGGHYRLAVKELRPAAPEDAERVDLERRILEVRLDRSSDDPDRLAHRIAGLERVADRFAALGDGRGRAEALVELADLYLEAAGLTAPVRAAAGLPEEPRSRAVEMLEEARDLQRERGDRAGEAEALLYLARAIPRHDPKQALDWLRQSLPRLREGIRLAEEAGDELLAARIRSDLGAAYMFLEKNEEAAAVLPSAVAAFRRLGHDRSLAAALTNRGVLRRRLEDERGGCLDLEQAARLWSHPDTLINLGDCHREGGRIDAAMTTFQEALRLAREQGRKGSEGRSLLNVGSLLAELGEYERAQATLTEASGLPLGPSYQAGLQVHRGWLAVVQERPEEGVEHFRRVVDEWADRSPTMQQVRDAREGLGYGLAAQGRYEEALAQLQTLVPEEGAPGVHPPASSSLLRHLGRVLMELDRLDEAKQHLEASLEAAEGQPGHRGAAYSALARLASRRGELDEALGHVARSIEIRESMRSSVAPPSLRAAYLARWRDDFSLWIDLLVRKAEQGDPASLRHAFAVSEQAHARTLREMLLEAGPDGRSPVPEPQAEERRILRERRADLIRQAAEAEAEGDDGLEERLAVLEDRLAELDWQRRRPFADRPEPPPLTPQQIQAALAPDQALLEYTLGTERSYLFVVTRRSLRVEPLPPAAELADLVAQARAGLASPRAELWRPLVATLHALHQLLLAPAEDHLEGIRRLVLVPDRELFYLPFETLLRELPEPLRDPAQLAPLYLLADREVSYVPSANVLVQLQELGARKPRREHGPLLVAFADSRGGSEPGEVPPGTADGARNAAPAGGWQPLPGARDEVAAIASRLPEDRVRVYLGPEATSGKLRRAPGEEGHWLHFAVHGNLDPRHPALSGLILADGELYAQEIYDLDLRAELAVLSACQTGLGKAVWGEELIGLSRAFFYAGVPTVVVSLWQVSDRSTAVLMSDFYDRLIAGDATVEALAGAKRRLLEERRWRHPYYWAPFVVMGLPGPAAGNGAAPGSPVRP